MPQTRRRNRQPAPLRLEKIRRFDRCVQRLRHDTEQFVEAYSNPSNAVNDQRYEQFNKACQEYTMSFLQCERLMGVLNSRERRDPNARDAIELLYKLVNQYNSVVDRWERQRRDHERNNPEVINLTGESNNNNSNNNNNNNNNSSSRRRSRRRRQN
jgi:hypothetical protein